MTDSTPNERPHTRVMSLMHVFRDAAAAGDARKSASSYREGDRELSRRSRQFREGAGEHALRENLSFDISSLMNTVRLDAAADLSDAPYVAKSVVNFGFADMSSLSRSHENTARMAESIRLSLMTHEPRLVPATIEVRVREDAESSDQRMSFDITAEMHASPADIPLDFVAEVDLGAGKLRMTRLQVQK